MRKRSRPVEITVGVEEWPKMLAKAVDDVVDAAVVVDDNNNWYQQHHSFHQTHHTYDYISIPIVHTLHIPTPHYCPPL